MTITSQNVVSNYPDGFTQGEHDRAFGGPRGKDFPNAEECFLCHRSIEQDDATRRWFYEEDVTAQGISYCLDYHDALDAFQTEQGWCCGADCWNENVALNEDESIPAPPRLQLVKGGRA